MKILIVGLGSIARKHIDAVKSIYPDAIFYALRSSINSKKDSDVIDLYNLQDINWPEISFAIISNPTSLHRDTIESLIPYKVPLFIEKPLFSNLEQSDILQKINQQEVITYVACNLRFLDSLTYTKKFIRGRRINEVNSYCGSYLPDWRPGNDFKKHYSANEKMGGGVHLDLIHEIDYLFWLFGSPISSKCVWTGRSSLKINASDYANYLLEYPDFYASLILNYYRRDPKRSLEILLEEGTVIVDILNNNVTFNGREVFASGKRIVDTYKDQILFFLKEVMQKNIKFNTVNDAFKVLTLCLCEN